MLKVINLASFSKETAISMLKKHYISPRLKFFGTVSELTFGPTGSVVDGETTKRLSAPT
jgi:hypothetical protein